MTVYVVTSGMYSCYGICEMFSTYEQAEKYIASENDRYGWDDYNIEKWVVDNCKIESANSVYYHYKYDILHPTLYIDNLYYNREYPMSYNKAYYVYTLLYHNFLNMYLQTSYLLQILYLH
jgi:hypothetical protein